LKRSCWWMGSRGISVAQVARNCNAAARPRKAFPGVPEMLAPEWSRSSLAASCAAMAFILDTRGGAPDLPSPEGRFLTGLRLPFVNEIAAVFA
jgi:hypothetical protein